MVKIFLELTFINIIVYFLASNNFAFRQQLCYQSCLRRGTNTTT